MSKLSQAGRRHVSFRMFQIEMLIKSGRPYGVKELADFFEVSPRTIQRDLEAMRDWWGAPLVYDRFRKRYYYEKDFALPRPNLSDGEMVALYLSEKLLGCLKGTPHEAQLASAAAKLRLYLTDSGNFKPEEIESGFISGAAEQLRGDGPAVAERFAKLEKARRQRRRTEIVHYSVQNERTTRRLLDPYHLYWRQGAWYVIGFCHLRKEVRMFALDRIREVRETDQEFQIPKDFKVEDYLKDSWGIERGKPATVRIRFDAYQSRWIRERVWHPSQRLTELEDGGVIFEAEVAGLREIKEWALSFGGHAEVLEPEELREEIRREIAKLAKMYQV